MSEKLSRQQIYDRIRTTSKDSYILEEMQRLGFWESSGMPTLSEILIKREAAANQELQKLLEQDRKYNDQEAMLKEMRKARMKLAREKRVETKQKHKEKATLKAEKWKQTQLQQIIYLGADVSAGLNNTVSDLALLKQFNLPVFENVTALAAAMKLDLAALRYLIYQRKVSRINHYHNFEVAKKSGGKRQISAPKPRLKELQLWVLETILNQVPVGDVAHGFIKDRSIVTNAQPHLQQDIVINVDLKDFFPSISYRRVKGLFHKLGYAEQQATILALICTQAETEEVEMDGQRYYVQKGNRVLPQGSPASPAISNLIAYKLDKKVRGLATKLNFNYSRYADDLSFSTTEDNQKNIAAFLYFLKKIIESEGFELHPSKTHIMRKGNLQKVTGIVVNEKLNVQRSELRKFRALLHNLESRGWQDQQWGKAKHLINAVEGYINYVHMVNPEKGLQFKKQLEGIVLKYGYPVVETTAREVKSAEPVPEPKPIETQTALPSNKPIAPATGDWWNIF